VYNPVNELCYNSIVYKNCGGLPHIDTANKFCYDGTFYDKCDGMEYNPSIYICTGGVAITARCNGESYNPLTQFCHNGTVYSLCSGKSYNPSTEFCSGIRVYALCGGSEYDPATEFCLGGALRSKAGNQLITCTGGWQAPNCGGADKNTVTLEANECVEIRVLEYTNQHNLPNLVMRCEIQGTQQSVSVTLAFNETAKTYTGSFAWIGDISLGKVKLGDNEFGTLCVTALSGATSVRCFPSQ
jgi:hypothetical protein